MQDPAQMQEEEPQTQEDISPADREALDLFYAQVAAPLNRVAPPRADRTPPLNDENSPLDDDESPPRKRKYRKLPRAAPTADELRRRAHVAQVELEAIQARVDDARLLAQRIVEAHGGGCCAAGETMPSVMREVAALQADAVKARERFESILDELAQRFPA